MISVEEALTFMEQYRQDFGNEEVPLLQSSGRTLALDVAADRDFPPFNRVTMDGIAIRMASFEAGQRDFSIEKIQAAGSAQQALDDVSHCIEVMTGAVLPEGCDAVIPYEDCQIAGDVASVQISTLRSFQNAHLRGSDSVAGTTLLTKGQKITPAMTGILASVGMDRVTVRRVPRIVICSTGDELVAVDEIPEVQQVRRSNVYMLAAALQEESINADICHLPDDKEAMAKMVRTLLEKYEVILFSGAVSKGKFDFLPEVLGELGVAQIFHRVSQRPGKPFLFGRAKQGTILFGFPGNPASTLVCYRIYFRHWLDRSMGSEPVVLIARLAEAVTFKPAFTLHLLVTLQNFSGEWQATPASGTNSGDMVSLARADAILSLPADREYFEAGESYPVLLLHG